MSSTHPALRSPTGSCRGSRRLVVGLLALVASFAGLAPVAAGATGAQNLDDAHVAVSAESRRRASHRLVRRGAHPVRRQARRRSRCLAHATRPGHQLPPSVAPATGPPDRRGPPSR